MLGDLAEDPVATLRSVASAASIDDALNLIEGLVQLPASSEHLPWLRCLAVEFLFVSGQIRQAKNLSVELRDCEIKAVAETALVTGQIAFSMIDLAAASQLARPVLKRSARPLDVPGIAAAAVLAGAAWHNARLETGIRLARLAAEHAASIPSPFWRNFIKLEFAAKLVDLGQTTEATLIVEAVASGPDRVGHPGHLTALDLVRAKILMYAGSPWAVQEFANGQALRSARRMGERLFTPTLLLHLGIASAYAEDFHSARGYLEERNAIQRRCDTASDVVPGCWLKLLVTLAEDGPAGAAAAIERLSSRDRPGSGEHGSLGLLPIFAQLPGSAAWCVRQAQAARREDLLGSILAVAERASALNPGLAQLALAAQHARALITGDAVVLAEAATQQEHGWARACAAGDLALMVQRSGSPALPGQARDRVAPPSDPAGDPKPLSHREKQVARLVLQGLTNRQIASRMQCSPHTVNFHIRNIFRKLGIRSRVEMARYLSEAGAS